MADPVSESLGAFLGGISGSAQTVVFWVCIVMLAAIIVFLFFHRMSFNVVFRYRNVIKDSSGNWVLEKKYRITRMKWGNSEHTFVKSFADRFGFGKIKYAPLVNNWVYVGKFGKHSIVDCVRYPNGLFDIYNEHVGELREVEENGEKRYVPVAPFIEVFPEHVFNWALADKQNDLMEHRTDEEKRKAMQILIYAMIIAGVIVLASMVFAYYHNQTAIVAAADTAKTGWAQALTSKLGAAGTAPVA